MDAEMARGQSPWAAATWASAGVLSTPCTTPSRLPAPHTPLGAPRPLEAMSPVGLPPRPPHAPAHERAHACRAPACAHGGKCVHARTRAVFLTPTPRSRGQRQEPAAPAASSASRAARPFPPSERVSEGPSAPRWAPAFRPHDRSWRQTAWTEPALTPKHCSTFWKLPPGCASASPGGPRG